MDTMQTSTPDPILPQPAIFSPTESSSPWFLWLIGGAALLTLGAALGATVRIEDPYFAHLR